MNPADIASTLTALLIAGVWTAASLGLLFHFTREKN